MILDILFKKKSIGRKMEQRGFTILELIITIFVFTVGVLGVYGVSQSSIYSVRYLNDRSNAIYLCQEGVEIIKNLRDGNFLVQPSPLPWDSGLETTGYYEVDYHTVNLATAACSGSCSYNDMKLLKLDSDKFYSYTAGVTNTKFKRKIYLERVGLPDDYLKVIVTVYWRDKGDHFVAMQDNLYGYWNP